MPDGWYIIKSFPYGKCLGFQSSLVCASDDKSDAFRWKFVQDPAGKIRCVTKQDVSKALSGGQQLSVTQYSGTSAQWCVARTPV
jgi:hypothetical protein